MIEEGEEEEKNTSFDNELLNHPLLKKNSFSMKKNVFCLESVIFWKILSSTLN